MQVVLAFVKNNMEYTNASDFSDNHIIIYGHHFRGAYRPMFTQLVDYKSEAFYKAHPVAQLFTQAGTYFKGFRHFVFLLQKCAFLCENI
jgi:hypothetical protein